MAILLGVMYVGAFIALSVIGAVMGGLLSRSMAEPPFPDFAVTSVIMSTTKPGTSHTTPKPDVACLGEKRVYVNARVEGRGEYFLRDGDAVLTFSGRPVDGLTEETISYTERLPLGYQPGASSFGGSARSPRRSRLPASAPHPAADMNQLYWWAPAVPAHFQDRATVWTVTVTYAPDQNTANNTSSELILPACQP